METPDYCRHTKVLLRIFTNQMLTNKIFELKITKIDDKTIIELYDDQNVYDSFSCVLDEDIYEYVIISQPVQVQLEQLPEFIFRNISKTTSYHLLLVGTGYHYLLILNSTIDGITSKVLELPIRRTSSETLVERLLTRQTSLTLENELLTFNNETLKATVQAGYKILSEVKRSSEYFAQHQMDTLNRCKEEAETFLNNCLWFQMENEKIAHENDHLSNYVSNLRHQLSHLICDTNARDESYRDEIACLRSRILHHEQQYLVEIANIKAENYFLSREISTQNDAEIKISELKQKNAELENEIVLFRELRLNVPSNETNSDVLVTAIRALDPISNSETHEVATMSTNSMTADTTTTATNAVGATATDFFEDANVVSNPTNNSYKPETARFAPNRSNANNFITVLEQQNKNARRANQQLDKKISHNSQPSVNTGAIPRTYASVVSGKTDRKSTKKSSNVNGHDITPTLQKLVKNITHT